VVLLSVDATASVSACWKSARAMPVFVVTASSTPGMMHVHFEVVVGPLWIAGPPVPSVDENGLTIRQFGGGGVDIVPGTPDHLCQVEDLDVPALPPGLHDARWWYVPPGAVLPIFGLHFRIDITDPLPETFCAATVAPVAYVRGNQLSF